MKSMNRVLALMMLFSLSSFAQEDDKYLQDLPEITRENIRWNFNSEDWFDYRNHLIKGPIVEFFPEKKNPDPNGAALRSEIEFKFYEKKNLEDRFIRYDISWQSFFAKDRQLCKENNDLKLKKYNEKLLVHCDKGYCRSYRGEDFSLSSDDLIRFPRSIDLTRKGERECPYSLQVAMGDYTVNSWNYNSYQFKVDKVPEIGDKYAEVSMNGRIYYMDLSFCLKNPAQCKFYNKRYSDYEERWIKMKKHQEKKDLATLNFLIKHLKPCVEKKDKECIQKFFLDESAVYGGGFGADDQPGNEIPSKKPDVTDEFLDELKTCLDYSRLLPHLEGLRGKKKVCMVSIASPLEPSQEKKGYGEILYSITYPEGVTGGGYALKE